MALTPFRLKQNQLKTLKTMRALACILVLFLFSDCSKNKELTIDSPCHQEMKERFESELKCIEKEHKSTNLFSGMYIGQRVYFTLTHCPACSTMPPKYGYTCDGRKITIFKFHTTVTAIKPIYDSCTKTFTE